MYVYIVLLFSVKQDGKMGRSTGKSDDFNFGFSEADVGSSPDPV